MLFKRRVTIALLKHMPISTTGKLDLKGLALTLALDLALALYRSGSEAGSGGGSGTGYGTGRKKKEEIQ